MEENKLELLNQPLEESTLSDDCKLYLKQQGFGNLQAIVTKGWAGLRSMDNFDYIKFNELIRFLQSKNLLSLMDT